jgi:uncharacterized protein (DUF58 family)
MARIKDTYLTPVFYFSYGMVILCYLASYGLPICYFIGHILLITLLSLTILDWILLFSESSPIKYERHMAKRMNLGDSNTVQLNLLSKGKLPYYILFFEGFPDEMQEREAYFKGYLETGQLLNFKYDFKPKKRGVITFKDPLIYLQSFFYLVRRKIAISNHQKISVYPSIIQMKRYELMVFQQLRINTGIKKTRRIGNASEFEQIKNYVQGDEIKKINWKATSRRNELMVNQFQQEKAQNIYFILDKSRNMQAEFEGMNLLDYAINSTLAIANVAGKTGDKTGLISFSNKLGTVLPAERSSRQMRRILEELYSQKSLFLEANYDLLFQALQRSVKTRSMILLFTNFETESSMKRVLPLLHKINQKHLLVVVLFQNTALEAIAFEPLLKIKDVYHTTVAERLSSIKERLAWELRKNGIQTILSNPNELSVKTINKYLELKAKGSL